MKTSIALKLSFILQALHVNTLFFLMYSVKHVIVAFTLLLSASFSWSFNSIEENSSIKVGNSTYFTQQLIQQHRELLDISLNEEHELKMSLSNLQIKLLSQLPCSREHIEFSHIGKNTVGNVRYQAHCITATESPNSTKKLTLNLNTKLIIPILLTKHAINTNSRIRAQDIYFKKTDISRLHTGYFTDKMDIIGLDVRRTLPAGKILTPLLIQPPLLIDKGNEVIIWVKIPGLMIKMTGIAMTSGRKGKQISVKNKSSGKIIKARVISRDLVEAI